MAFPISILAGITITVISSIVKCIKSGDYIEGGIDSIDNIFGGVVGNVFHQHYDKIVRSVDSGTTKGQNCDVERTVRDALLQALITFNQHIKENIQTIALTEVDQEEFLLCLDVSNKAFITELGSLSTKSDDYILSKSKGIDGRDTFITLLSGQESDKIERIKVTLAAQAILEYGYAKEHFFHQALLPLLTNGLPNKAHWFAYFIHSLFSNIKTRNTLYASNASEFLKQKGIVDLIQLNEAMLQRLDSMLHLSREIVATVDLALKIMQDILVQNAALQGQNNQIFEMIEVYGVDLRELRGSLSFRSATIPIDSIILNERYVELTSTINTYNVEIASHQAEVEALAELMGMGRAVSKIDYPVLIDRHQQRIFKLDTLRRTVINELFSFTQGVLEMAIKLAPSPDRDSALLQAARTLFLEGDYLGANEILNEVEIDKMVITALDFESKALLARKKAAQAFITKAQIIVEATIGDWKTEAARFAAKAIEIFVDARMAFDVGLIFQKSGFISESEHYYLLSIDQYNFGHEKAYVYNNLGTLFYYSPEHVEKAKYYFATGLNIYADLAQELPEHREMYATVAYNLGCLLCEYTNDFDTGLKLLDSSFHFRNQLANENPGVYILTALNSLVTLAYRAASRNNHHQTARTAFAEAIRVSQNLALLNPDNEKITEQLASALSSYSDFLRYYPDELNEALILGRKALVEYERLATVSPSEHLHRYAAICHDVAVIMFGIDATLAEIRPLVETSLRLYKQLEIVATGKYLSKLARVLDLKSRVLMVEYLKDGIEESIAGAIDLQQQSIAIRRELARFLEGGFSIELANSLAGLAGSILLKDEAETEARLLFREAIVILNKGFRTTPELFKAPLALHILSYVQYLLPTRFDDIAVERYIDECVKHLDSLVHEFPGLYETQHASAHFVEGLCLYIKAPGDSRAMELMVHNFHFLEANKNKNTAAGVMYASASELLTRMDVSLPNSETGD